MYILQAITGTFISVFILLGQTVYVILDPLFVCAPCTIYILKIIIIIIIISHKLVSTKYQRSNIIKEGKTGDEFQISATKITITLTLILVGGTISIAFSLQFIGRRFKSYLGTIAQWPLPSHLHLCASVT